MTDTTGNRVGAPPSIPRPRVVRRTNLSTQVREALEDLIVFGTLRPGEHLGEVALAERLGVSRQPVREALRVLAGVGFVDIATGRGATVHVPTEREIREVFHVRALLEADSAALAARTIDDDGLTELNRICGEGDRAIADGDTRPLIELNEVFHRTVANIAGNRVTITLLDQLQRRVGWYLGTIIVQRAPSSWDEHRQIVQALQAYDGEAAHRLMLDHVHHSLTSFEITDG